MSAGPWNIAGDTVFLASAQSHDVTVQTLNIDGGAVVS